MKNRKLKESNLICIKCFDIEGKYNSWQAQIELPVDGVKIIELSKLAAAKKKRGLLFEVASILL